MSDAATQAATTTTTPAASSAAPDAAAAAAAATALTAAPGEQTAAPAAAAPADEQNKPAEDGQNKPATRAPAEYTDFSGPDGYTLDPSATGEFKALAKELDLTQEQAQKLINLDAKRQQSAAVELDAQSTKWLNELPSDKEFGGEKLSENLAIAKKAIDAFGTPELKEILDKSRLGNNPEVIRAFYRAGKAISQDSRLITGGSGATPAKGDKAAALYPNQKPT